jgi:hypothetical protein
MGDAGWRIRIDRSGGFAGARIGGEVRSDQLSGADAEELSRLISAIDFSGQESSAQPQPGQPDRFEYHLIAEQGDDQYQLTARDGAMDASVNELVRWLMSRVRAPSGQ